MDRLRASRRRRRSLPGAGREVGAGVRRHRSGPRRRGASLVPGDQSERRMGVAPAERRAPDRRGPGRRPRTGVMTQPADRDRGQRPLRTWWWRWLWRAGTRIAPLAVAIYVNRSRRYLGREPDPMPQLSDQAWLWRHQEALLDQSEQRLRGIEAKGPGLATTSAIFAAGVGIAIAEAWSRQTVVGQVLLIASAAYVALSLVT